MNVIPQFITIIWSKFKLRGGLNIYRNQITKDSKIRCDSLINTNIFKLAYISDPRYEITPGKFYMERNDFFIHYFIGFTAKESIYWEGSLMIYQYPLKQIQKEVQCCHYRNFYLWIILSRLRLWQKNWGEFI